MCIKHNRGSSLVGGGRSSVVVLWWTSSFGPDVDLLAVVRLETVRDVAVHGGTRVVTEHPLDQGLVLVDESFDLFSAKHMFIPW